MNKTALLFIYRLDTEEIFFTNVILLDKAKGISKFSSGDYYVIRTPFFLSQFIHNTYMALYKSDADKIIENNKYFVSAYSLSSEGLKLAIYDFLRETQDNLDSLTKRSNKLTKFLEEL